MTEIYDMSLTHLDQGLRNGSFSLDEMMESLVTRIGQREDATQAFTILDLDKTQTFFSQIKSQPRTSAISGIPFGVKDIFNTWDAITAYGSDIYSGHQPVSDASVISQLRAAGGVVMGKTVTTEFAYFFPGKTRNPRHLEHTPGGSSQGSAAAVADFMAPFALGSQTAASVIRPAAFCGVIGYKASVGQFPLNGVLTLSYSMDSLGFFVRDPGDLQLLRNILLHQSSNIGLRQPRKVGLVRTPYWGELDDASQSILEMLRNWLGATGVEIDEVEVDGYQDTDLVGAHQTVMAYEVSRTRAVEYENYAEQLSKQFLDLIEQGRQIDYGQYREALKQRDAAKQRLSTELDHYDLFLTPSALGEAPHGLSSTGDPVFSRAWNLLGVPAITLPVGTGGKGLPLGVQLVGHSDRDDDLIARARWMYEHITSGIGG